MRPLYERLGEHAGILALLHPFYADVRQHATLGPVFNARVKNWPEHLERIAGFWARQTGGPSNYDGGFAAAHLRLMIPPEFVDQWLALWDFNCRRQLSEPEVGEMIQLARDLGGNLRRILAHQPGFTIGRS